MKQIEVVSQFETHLLYCKWLPHRLLFIGKRHAAIINDGTMEDMGKPVQSGKTTMAGITLTKKRNLALMESILALMTYPKGFDCANLKEMMNKKRFSNYTINNTAANICVSYRGKNLLEVSL